jgi:F420-dependent oxidoreductase-like protein
MTTFGLQLPDFAFGVPDAEMFDQVVARATAAEESGFSSLWVMDHFFQLPVLGGATMPILEAYTLLGAIAARTERVRLGTLVTGVTYRNPALVAKTVTTLDVISKGRAVLGIGAAWHDLEHDALGFDFPPVRERMDRLEEAVQICRAMFRDEAPTFKGTYYFIDGAYNVPRPVQPGGPPIMIGGGGEKRTLRLVAQYADLCNVAGGLDIVRQKLDVLAGHCAAVGREASEIKKTRLGSLFLTASAEETKSTRDFVVAAAGEEALGGFTVGQEDDVVGQVKRFIDAGLDELIFNMPFATPATIARAGRLLTSTFG